ncbi:MAG: ABC transporter substrate-binding protein [Bacteroidia bacterium]
MTFSPFLLIISFIISGCSENTSDQNVVVAHLLSEPDNLHPTNGVSEQRSFIFRYSQATLLDLDIATEQMVPMLTSSLPHVSPDGLTYTFTLREDVQWDDGETLTPDDVLFTLKVVLCPLTENATTKSLFENIEDFEQTSAYSFKLKMREKYVGNLASLTTLFLLHKRHYDPEDVLSAFSLHEISRMDPDSAVNEKAERLKKWMESFNSGTMGHEPAKLYGLGPYQVTEWNTGNSVTLEKKNDWWGEDDTLSSLQAIPEKIIFRIIRDEAAVSLALQKEELDVSTYLHTSTLMELQEKEQFNETYYSGYVDQYSYTYIALNMRPDGTSQKPFFSDKRVRRAMALLVPYDELIETILHGKGGRQVSFESPLNKMDYNDTLALLNPDIEKARRLLEAAGWKDTDGDNIRDKTINGEKISFVFKLNYSNLPATRNAILILKDIMYQAGIVVEPNPMDFNLLYEKVMSHQFDAHYGAWNTSAGPTDPGQVWSTEAWRNNGLNFSGFGNSTTDSLIALSNRTLDPEKRAKYIKQLQAIVYQEQPYIFLYTWPRKIAIHKRFDNPGMYPERPSVMLNTFRLIPGGAVKRPLPE